MRLSGGNEVAPSKLVRSSRQSGSWQPAARWLAASLNELDASIRSGVVARSERASEMGARVSSVDGDHRDTDLVVLPDGTRVCWHLAPSKTAWVVEGRGERCALG